LPAAAETKTLTKAFRYINTIKSWKPEVLY